MAEVNVTIWLPEPEYELALILANAQGVSVSDVTKRAIEEYVGRHNVGVE